MNRRDFLKTAAALPVAALLSSACGRRAAGGGRVVMLGVDGMDPAITRAFIHRGLMPNCRRLAEMGGMGSLATELPPQSPVAWSSFITGLGPDRHGIFDFVHRDPSTLAPYLSTSVFEPGGRSMRLGGRVLPLERSSYRLLRRGDPFWGALTGEGIPVTLIKLPVDFPPDSSSGARILCGLGTPDVRGSQGSFTFMTDNPYLVSDDTSGGIVVSARASGSRYRISLEGPPDPFSESSAPVRTEISVTVDRASGGALVETGEDTLVLGTGEWSRWAAFRFEMLGGLSEVRAIGRFHLASVDPHLELYLSPLNADPSDPALPICAPGRFSADIARRTGPFHTKGFPEDTKALSRGVLDDPAYMQQALDLFEEQLALMRYGLSHHCEGLLFTYFTTLDLNLHAFYRALDPGSPLHSTVHPDARGFVGRLYSLVDSAIGEAMDHIDGETLLMVFSDHGFAPFRRGFNLNTWLEREGWARLSNPYAAGEDMFAGTDWASTAAYGLGINSLYLNIRGREQAGCVEPSGARALLGRIRSRLESVIDPRTGLRPVRRAWILRDIYGPGLPPHAPDMIVGYSSGYRASWETTLGSYPEDVLTDNLDPWSGDHCMDPAVVPGVVISSEPLGLPDPALRDMGRTACAWLGTSRMPPGRDILAPPG